METGSPPLTQPQDIFHFVTKYFYHITLSVDVIEKYFSFHSGYISDVIRDIFPVLTKYFYHVILYADAI